MAQYNKGITPQWSEWKVQACLSALEYYKTRGWIEDGKDHKTSFNQLQSVMLKHFMNKELMVKRMITMNLDFKVFLYLHSTFQLFYDTNDWLLKIIRENLVVTPEEMIEYTKQRSVPKQILDKLKAFDPEPVYFEYYPVNISYGFWQRNSSGNICDPVRIVDKSLLGSNRSNNNSYYEAGSYVSQFNEINLKTWEPCEDTITWEKYKKQKAISEALNEEEIKSNC